MIYGQNKYRSYFKSFNKNMISRIFIFLIVFIFFENLYAKHDGNNLKIKEKNSLEEMNKKIDNLTSILEENQNQIRSLSCWANPVRNIENKIYWISHSSIVHKYTLEGGWTFGNYNRRTVILTIFS